jgi:hypothetical protein
MGKTNFPMSGRGQKSVFTPKNKEKYIGDYPILSRSSWELKMMQYFDTHPNVLFWASESLKIPYVNPFTKKIANYYPDFLCIFKDKSGKQRKEIIEIKPKSQTLIESAKTKNDKEALALNYYKWAAATKFAKDNGMTFRVLNEDDIFGKT